MTTVLVLHDVSTSVWRRQLAGVKRYADARGWRIRSVLSDGSRESVARAVARTRPDGVITLLNERLFREDLGGVPVVYFDCSAHVIERGVPYVRNNAEAIAHLAASELFTMKRECFAFAGFADRFHDGMPFWSRSRMRFFEREVKLRRGALAAPFIPRGPFGCGRGAALLRDVRKWLAALPKPCGVFAANDAIAAKIRAAAAKENLRIPEDVAVVGVDDDRRVCLGARPSMTSVVPDWEGGGWTVAATLADLLDGRDMRRVRRKFEPLGIARRESTARSQGRTDPRILEAVSLIRARACSGLVVDRIVAATGASRRFAEKLFRETTGSSILEEIRRVRFQKARVLLAHSALPLERVVRECGYSSKPTFCREFRRISGMTPLAWREMSRMAK